MTREARELLPSSALQPPLRPSHWLCLAGGQRPWKMQPAAVRLPCDAQQSRGRRGIDLGVTSPARHLPLLGMGILPELGLWSSSSKDPRFPLVSW